MKPVGQCDSIFILLATMSFETAVPLRAHLPLATHSLWLFSKKAEAPPPPTSTLLPETLDPDPVAPALVDTTSPLILSAADAAAMQVTALPPPDTLAVLTHLQYGDLTALGLTGWTPAGLSSCGCSTSSGGR